MSDFRFGMLLACETTFTAGSAVCYWNFCSFCCIAPEPYHPKHVLSWLWLLFCSPVQPNACGPIHLKLPAPCLLRAAMLDLTAACRRMFRLSTPHQD